MKKLLIALGLGALLMGTTAMAESENSAWVYSFDNVCAMDVSGVGVVTDGDMHIVMTKSGTSIVKCTNMIVPEGNEPAKVIKEEYPCTLISRLDAAPAVGVAKIMVTPGGIAKFECKVNASTVD